MRKWLVLLAMAVQAYAADLNGKWKGTAETPNGTIERTFQFKVDGEKLTGTTNSEMLGQSTIMDGKVSGDTITFTINVKFQDNEMKLTYNGKITGDTIKFKVDGVNGMVIEYNVKKVS
jgi:hypothetical protein